jgi:hypothetical protein
MDFAAADAVGAKSGSCYLPEDNRVGVGLYGIVDMVAWVCPSLSTYDVESLLKEVCIIEIERRLYVLQTSVTMGV